MIGVNANEKKESDVYMREMVEGEKNASAAGEFLSKQVLEI